MIPKKGEYYIYPDGKYKSFIYIESVKQYNNLIEVKLKQIFTSIITNEFMRHSRLIGITCHKDAWDYKKISKDEMIVESL